MHYRAVGNRCAVDLGALKFSFPENEALAQLERLGFRIIQVDLAALARERVGKSVYRLGARLKEAPEIFDCSSFAKWLYGLRGVWLPRKAVQQREYGEVIGGDKIAAGDLVFSSGVRSLFYTDLHDGVGHVGIATGQGTIVHAANSKLGIIEEPFEDFAKPKNLRGVRRYLPLGQEVLTLEVPVDRDVETSDDLYWLALIGHFGQTPHLEG